MTTSKRTGEELLKEAGIDPATANGNGSTTLASTAELLGELRAAASRIRLEYTSQADRMVAMRETAQGLGLAVRDGELLSYLWQARNGEAGPVQPLTPADRLSLAEAPWLWEGVVMAEALNLLVALPKIGKTALVLGWLAAWIHGQQSFLDCALPSTSCPSVLIVGTDQPESDWGRMLAHFHLLPAGRPHPQIVALFTAGRPLHLNPEGIERIAGYAAQHPGLVVVIDSLSACVSPLGLKEESAEIAEPIRDLMEAVAPYRATVVLIHHANKARAQDGAVAASRGSTALPAVASQTIGLTRLQPAGGGQAGNSERRVMLKTEGRGGHPLQRLIERTEDGWICHGDGETALLAQRREKEKEKLTANQSAVLRLLCQRQRQGQETTAQIVADELDAPPRNAREFLGALVRKQLVIKRQGDTPSGEDGGRPANIYVPVPDACEYCTPDIPPKTPQKVDYRPEQLSL